MTYEVIIYEQAQIDMARLAKAEPKAFIKAQRLQDKLFNNIRRKRNIL